MEKKKETEAKEETKQPGTGETDHNNSAIYIKEEETGRWVVRNPSGSIGYNYLYRDEYD